MKKILFIFWVLLVAVLPAAGELAWNRAAPLAIAREGHCAAVADGRIYVFGGTSTIAQRSYVAAIEAYDPVADRWRTVGRMPVGLFQASAVTLDSSIYIFGGLTADGLSGSVYRFDIRTNQIEDWGRLPAPRRAMGALKVGQRVLVIGGIEGRSEVVRTGYWWDPSSREWSRAPSLNHPSASFGLIQNGGLWAMGGIYFGLLDRVESYHEGGWEDQRGARLPEPRGDMGVALLGDSVLVTAGGLGPNGSVNAVNGYSLHRAQWRRLPALPAPRSGFPLVSLGGKLYAIGGGSHRAEHMMDISREVWVLSDVNATPLDPVIPSELGLVTLPVWPNPTNGRFTVGTPLNAGTIQMWNGSGRLILEQRFGRVDHLVFDSVELPSGIYYIRAQDERQGDVGRGQVIIDR